MSDELKFYYNGSETVIAYSAEDAEKVYFEITGLSSHIPEDDESPNWEELTTNPISLSFEDIYDAEKYDAPPESTKDFGDNQECTITASQEQWITKLGRCYFSTENW